MEIRPAVPTLRAFLRDWKLGINFTKSKLIILSSNKTQSLKLQKYFISGLNKIINEYKIWVNIFLPRTTKVPAYTLNLK